MPIPADRLRTALTWGSSVALVIALVSPALIGGVTPARASFAVATSNSGNSFTASSTFCTPGGTTVYATADTDVREDSPTRNYGTDARLRVRPYRAGKTEERRVLVTFTLPTIPAGCSVTSATLLLNATSSTAGRTIAVYRNSGAWIETGVTWNTKPGYTGTAVTAASGSGWRSWAVTAHVTAMYSGTNYGFVVMDATAGNREQQVYWSRERSATDDPQLIVNWG